MESDRFAEALTPDDVEGWDSLGHLRLVTALQERFGIEFDVDEIMEMENVGRIRGLLVARGVPA